MSNPVFKYQRNSMPQSSSPNQNGSQMQPQLPDFGKLFEQFKQDPDKYLGNLNIPSNVQTPEEKVRYLAATNQIPPLLQKQIYAMLGKK